MLNFGRNYCPLCKIEFSDDRIQCSPIVCDQCGWSEPKNQIIKHQRLQVSTIKVFIVFSVIITAVYFHTVKWGHHSIAIIPLKISEWTGNMSLSNAKEIANICAERKQVKCVIQSYEKIVNKNPSEIIAYSLLANTLEKANRGSEAINYYARYFTLGGTDNDMAFHFAKLLEKNHDNENAIKYYEYVINSKPDVFQITVSKDYVNLLIKMGELNKAKNFIKLIREKGQNAPMFMEDELKLIASNKSL